MEKETKKEKRTLALQEGDELLSIGRRIARLQKHIDALKRAEKEIDLLKIKGAEIMARGGFTHTSHPEFTGYLLTHYAGTDYGAVVGDIPDFWKKYRNLRIPMKTPKFVVFPKKKNQ